MIDIVANGLKRAVFPISRGLGAVAMAILVVMMVFTVIDVFMRRFLNSPIRGIHELTELSFALIVFLALAYCAVRDGHITVDTLVKKFPKTVAAIIDAIILLATSGILGLVSWQLVVHALNLQRMNQETVSLGVIVYPFVYLGAVGTMLITLVYFIQFLYSLTKFKEV